MVLLDFNFIKKEYKERVFCLQNGLFAMIIYIYIIFNTFRGRAPLVGPLFYLLQNVATIRPPQLGNYRTLRRGQE